MPRNLVLFDLEWNIGYQPYTFNYHGVQQTFRGEIVEIGAVKIDEDANVLDTFSIHLRPRIFRKLQHHIAKVTGLTQADLDKGEPIVQGLRRFMQWCGPDAEFAEWGMDDVPVLKQNLYLCNIDESKPTVWYDLQQVFLREHPRKEGEGMTLESVVTRLGLPMERQFHDALSDTLYTADVCRMLDLRAGLAAYPTEEESLRASLCPTPGDYRDFEVFRGYVEQYTNVSNGKFLGINYLIWIAIIVAAITWFIFNMTRHGKYMYAIGGNPQAAEVAGVPVKATLILIYMKAAAMYGLAGFMLGAKAGGASVQTGYGYEMEAIAACTIGGVSVTGGRGKVSSAIIGVAVFELLKVALQYLGMNANAQYIAIGVVIFIAISLDIRKYIARK